MAYSLISDGTTTVLTQDGTFIYEFVNENTTVSMTGHEITLTEGEYSITFIDELIEKLDSTEDRERDIFNRVKQIFGITETATNSNIIAQGIVDLSVAGTYDLDFADGVTFSNQFPTGHSIQAYNDTDVYTNDAGQGDYSINFNSLDFVGYFQPRRKFSTHGAPVYGGKSIRSVYEYASTVDQFDSLTTADGADKWQFVVGATPPSTTQFRVLVTIYGFKI